MSWSFVSFLLHNVFQPRIITFHDFHSKKIINDVALLKTDRFISLGGPIGTICLATLTMPLNKEVTATGWGGTNVQHEGSDILKEVCKLESWIRDLNKGV